MSRDTSFYYSFLVLPPAQRRAIIAVWDFCRVADDAVDQQYATRLDSPGSAGGGEANRENLTGSRVAELERWRGELDRAFGNGAPPATPQGQALAHWVRAFQLTRRHFDTLMAGVEMDLQPRRYERLPELREYAERVASAVGLICLEIFGVRDGSADAYAHELGIALQLTNILRDVPSDLEAGRIYLLREDQEAAGCTDDMLREAVAARAIHDERVRALLARHGAHARRQFARVAELFPRRHARKLVAAEIMNAVYRRLLDKIEARHFDVVSERVTVPRPARARVALGVYLRTLAGIHRPRS
ncbi:MAG TPA: squalene/phytoene synthase family protein [Vicinamibacterales bacterium]|nr:squalene/phytoene synthase family protein [Vicinamibacterales bacterium]